MRKKCGLFTASIVILGLQVAIAQNYPPEELLQKRVPDFVAFEGVVRLMGQVEEKFSPANGRGNPGLRSAVVKRMNLSESDFTTLLGVSRSLNGKLRALDAQAKAIVVRERNTRKGSVPTSPPPELLDLQRQREEAVKDAMKTADIQLSQQGRTNLHDYGTALFGNRARVIKTK